MKNKILIFIILVLCFTLGITTVALFVKNLQRTDIETVTDNTPSSKITKPSEKPQAEAEDNDPYGDEIFSLFENLGGNVQIGYKVFGGDECGIRGEGAVPSASVIKIFIMDYIFTLADKEGEELSDSTYSLLKNMIIYSDNDATNTLIDKYKMDNINAFIKEEGYSDTYLQRKMLDEEARHSGRDNLTSAKDVLKFLEKLYENQDVPRNKRMLEILMEQTRRNKIPRLLPGSVRVANKTGEHDNIENDIGIVFSDKCDVAMVFLCTEISDKGYAQSLISEAALKLCELTHMTE